MPKKLVCDRCGFELTDKEEVESALEGQDAWQMASRARGVKPRGIIPCKHYVRCSGEMQVVKMQPKWIAKLSGRKEQSR